MQIAYVNQKTRLPKRCRLHVDVATMLNLLLRRIDLLPPSEPDANSASENPGDQNREEEREKDHSVSDETVVHVDVERERERRGNEHDDEHENEGSDPVPDALCERRREDFLEHGTFFLCCFDSNLGFKRHRPKLTLNNDS
jgi:hypothetical protein